MEKSKDYNSFKILGYYIDPINEKELNNTYKIIEYDELKNINYGLTFENLLQYYINGLKNNDLWRAKHVLTLIAGIRHRNELESIIIENLPEDIYVNYIIRRR